MAIPIRIEITLPWSVLGADRAKALEVELSREIPPGHVLQERKVKALAARIDRDHVLFEIEENTTRLALVHMTWRKEDSPSWPSTMLFKS